MASKSQQCGTVVADSMSHGCYLRRCCFVASRIALADHGWIRRISGLTMISDDRAGRLRVWRRFRSGWLVAFYFFTHIHCHGSLLRSCVLILVEVSDFA